MAKKKKKKAKKAVSRRRKKSVKASSRKRKAGTRKKVSRKRKAKKSTKKASSKKARKATKRKSSTRRKSRRGGRPKMITHRHAKTTRHFKKGETVKFKTTARKGKKKLTVSGRVKVNPSYRRNPMKLSAKKYLGMDTAELTGLAAGGLLVPIINGAAGKFAPTMVAKASEIVGPQAVGSVIPLVGGAILNAIAEHGVKSGQAHRALKVGGEGLVAAGIIGLMISISSRYLAPVTGLQGINFTPSMGIMPQLSGRMGDIRFTPKSMGDIQFTPERMQPNPDFGAADYGGNAGYTQSHKFSRADFGADFSSDSEADFYGEEGDMLSSAMN